MNDEEGPASQPPKSGDDLEITDLHPHARRLMPWTAASLGGVPLTTRQRLWRLTSGVGAVLVLLTAIFAINHNPVRQPTPTTTPKLASSILLHQPGGVTCIADATWSPDSKQIALIGYQGACLTGEYLPGVVDVYDASSGQLVSWFAPDPIILRVLAGANMGSQPAITRTDNTHAAVIARQISTDKAPIIRYGHVLWSPTSQTLVLTFSVFRFAQGATASAGITRDDGAMVISPGGKNSQVYLTPRPLDAFTYTEWDLRTGALLPLPGPPAAQPSPAIAVDVTRAWTPAFRWETAGRLEPDQQVQPTSLSCAPPGQPDGGPSFTAWQPGLAELTTTGAASTAGVFSWNTAFAALSPDGRYLIDTLGLAAQLDVPGQQAPDDSELAALAMTNVPAVPAPDTALAQLMASLPGITHDPIAQTLTVAWRPDGRIAAAYSDSTRAPTGITVALFDCASGQKLVSLVPASATQDTLSAQTLLRWSPGGSRLLLASGALGSLTVWDLKNVPALHR